MVDGIGRDLGHDVDRICVVRDGACAAGIWVTLNSGGNAYNFFKGWN